MVVYGIPLVRAHTFDLDGIRLTLLDLFRFYCGVLFGNTKHSFQWLAFNKNLITGKLVTLSSAKIVIARRMPTCCALFPQFSYV